MFAGGGSASRRVLRRATALFSDISSGPVGAGPHFPRRPDGSYRRRAPRARRRTAGHSRNDAPDTYGSVPPPRPRPPCRVSEGFAGTSGGEAPEDQRRDSTWTPPGPSGRRSAPRPPARRRRNPAPRECVPTRTPARDAKRSEGRRACRQCRSIRREIWHSLSGTAPRRRPLRESFKPV